MPTRTAHDVSRHRTSEGTLVYARRDDGGLQVWLEPRARPAELLLDGRARADHATDAAAGDAPRAACA